MAQQEDGWPLGLQPLNARVGLVRNRDRNGSISFSTLLTGSPTSATDSSSDLDTENLMESGYGINELCFNFSQNLMESGYGEWLRKCFKSTGSFFRDKSITLGSLIGVSNILELSRRSMRGRVPSETSREKRGFKQRPWLFSLCSKLTTDAVNMNNNNNNNTPSLGHLLEAERRVSATTYRRNQSPVRTYEPGDFSHVSDPNSLFVAGHVAPPPDQASSWLDSNGENLSNTKMFEHGNGSRAATVARLQRIYSGKERELG
ncbi:hypothetical protein TEA_007516 [Camellia sinensis var. sinensis]|uniref:Uncharacterized protein n=1 Tax=Camellia sinensis var. sinensis TaxID=542762 RepID=A0A4S4DEH8_CAMSN|nr:hypothetical protein TEA_007516 [Camellia sinensis var. sinensis]